MESPADLINAAIGSLLQEQYELPAFSTLDRIAGRIRYLVNGGIYRMCLPDSAQNNNRCSGLFSGSMDRLLSPPLIVSKNRQKVLPSPPG
jgi:hypothetical protein